MNPSNIAGIPSGPPFFSVGIDIGALTLASTPPRVGIFKGFGYGFVIVPNTPDGLFAAAIKVNVLGVGKIGNQDMLIAPNTWYEGAFQGLEVAPVVGGYIGADNQFTVNIALNSWARIHPSSQLTPANMPALIGGAPRVDVLQTTQNLTGTPPTLNTDGIAFGAGNFVGSASQRPGQVESQFQVFVQNIGGGNITGGSVDLYKYVWDLLAWCFVGNYPLQIPSTPVPAVGTVSDAIGVRQGFTTLAVSDRLAAVPNNVTCDDGALTVLVDLRLQ